MIFHGDNEILIYIHLYVCYGFGIGFFFLIPFRVWSGEMERVMKEAKRRYSSFLGDFEKEYIFPLDCRIRWMDTVLASEERVKWLIEIVISFVEESLFNKSS